MASARESDFEGALAGSLARLRSQRGLTQQGLGDELGLDQAAVSRVEGGNRRLTVGEAFGWLEALGLTPHESASVLEELWSERGGRPQGFWRSSG